MVAARVWAVRLLSEGLISRRQITGTTMNLMIIMQAEGRLSCRYLWIYIQNHILSGGAMTARTGEQQFLSLSGTAFIVGGSFRWRRLSCHRVE